MASVGLDVASEQQQQQQQHMQVLQRDVIIERVTVMNHMLWCNINELSLWPLCRRAHLQMHIADHHGGDEKGGVVDDAVMRRDQLGHLATPCLPCHAETI